MLCTNILSSCLPQYPGHPPTFLASIQSLCVPNYSWLKCQLQKAMKIHQLRYECPFECWWTTTRKWSQTLGLQMTLTPDPSQPLLRHPFDARAAFKWMTSAPSKSDILQNACTAVTHSTIKVWQQRWIFFCGCWHRISSILAYYVYSSIHSLSHMFQITEYNEDT